METAPVSFKLISYTINESIPTYANKSRVKIHKMKSINDGDSVNESTMNMPIHAGTHLDFPNHFYGNGQTLKDFPESFWICEKPLLITVEARGSLLLGEEIIAALKAIESKPYDILLIKALPQVERDDSNYWKNNYGIDAKVASYLRNSIPTIKMIGMNSISLTSYQHREAGRKSHLEFLDPEHPILVIEDMNLLQIREDQVMEKVIVSPLMVEGTDGVPVTVWVEMKN